MRDAIRRTRNYLATFEAGVAVSIAVIILLDREWLQVEAISAPCGAST